LIDVRGVLTRRYDRVGAGDLPSTGPTYGRRPHLPAPARKKHFRVCRPAAAHNDTRHTLVRLLKTILEPADVTTAPDSAIQFVANQLAVDTADLGDYTARQHTVSDHITEIERHLDFSRLEPGGLKTLGDWIVEQALGRPTDRAVPHGM